MVETALVLITLLSMILFILDMGRVLLLQQFITERAREGVRYAVVNNWDQTDVQNYIVYGSTTAPSGAGPGVLGLTTAQVTFTSVADSGINDARYQVQVSGVQFPVFIPYIASSFTTPTVTVTAPAESRGATN
jgi:Flp pilus assembly protein TadG